MYKNELESEILIDDFSAVTKISYKVIVFKFVQSNGNINSYALTGISKQYPV